MGGVGVRCGLLCRLSSRSQSICKCLWLSRFNIHRKNRLLLVITFAWLAQWKVLKAYSSNTWDSCNVRRIVCLVLSFLHVGFFPTNRWGHIIRWWCSHLDNTARSAGMRYAELEVLVQWYLSYDPYDLWFSWIQKTATVVWQCVAVQNSKGHRQIEESGASKQFFFLQLYISYFLYFAGWFVPRMFCMPGCWTCCRVRAAGPGGCKAWRCVVRYRTVMVKTRPFQP